MTNHELLGFPRYWVIQRSDDPRRERFIEWVNKYYTIDWTGNGTYYGYDGNDVYRIGTNCRNEIEYFQNNPKLITLDQREQRTKSKPSQTKQLSPVRSCTYDGKKRTNDTIDWVSIDDLNEELQTNKDRNKEIQKLKLQHRNLFKNPNK